MLTIPSQSLTTKCMIDFADRINSIPKMVFSKILEKADWNNTRLLRGNIVEEVLKLRRLPGKALSIGGITVASSLMKANLIYDYWLMVQPVACGSGRRLFDGLDGDLSSS